MCFVVFSNTFVVVVDVVVAVVVVDFTDVNSGCFQ